MWSRVSKIWYLCGVRVNPSVSQNHGNTSSGKSLSLMLAIATCTKAASTRAHPGDPSSPRSHRRARRRAPAADGPPARAMCRSKPLMPRTAVCEAVHGIFPNGYVQYGLGHIDSHFHHVPTSPRTRPVSLSSTLVDTGLTPLYLFGATISSRGVSCCMRLRWVLTAPCMLGNSVSPEMAWNCSK